MDNAGSTTERGESIAEGQTDVAAPFPPIPARAMQTEREARREAIRVAREAELATARAAREAEREANRAARDAERDAERAAWDAERAAWDAQRAAWDAERVERTAEREADLEPTNEAEPQRKHQVAVATNEAAVLQEITVRLRLLTANLVGLASRQDEGFRALRSNLAVTGGAPAADLYLDLLEAALTGTLDDDPSVAPWALGAQDHARRSVGHDWPATAPTMIGTARMRNLRMLTQRVLAEGVPGDLIETGVWRGGACIYLRGILAAAGDQDRRVFVADSFRGLPPPDEVAYPADKGDRHHTFAPLAVSRAEVEANFRRFRLLDERVVFLEGWFKDTLPEAPIERLALLRLDGDMYESTIDALNALYAKVSVGGFVIVDDYILRPCAQAVDDFRARHQITAPLVDVDGAAVWWQVGEADPSPTAAGGAGVGTGGAPCAC